MWGPWWSRSWRPRHTGRSRAPVPTRGPAQALAPSEPQAGALTSLSGVTLLPSPRPHAPVRPGESAPHRPVSPLCNDTGAACAQKAVMEAAPEHARGPENHARRQPLPSRPRGPRRGGTEAGSRPLMGKPRFCYICLMPSKAECTPSREGGAFPQSSGARKVPAVAGMA